MKMKEEGKDAEEMWVQQVNFNLSKEHSLTQTMPHDPAKTPD